MKTYVVFIAYLPDLSIRDKNLLKSIIMHSDRESLKKTTSEYLLRR